MKLTSSETFFAREGFLPNGLSNAYPAFKLMLCAFSSFRTPNLKDSSRSAQPFFSILRMDATGLEVPERRKLFQSSIWKSKSKAPPPQIQITRR
ncbi:MAG TPA: hypothetical protein VGC66_04875 [Pyrinomonadaceae bacterium]